MMRQVYPWFPGALVVALAACGAHHEDPQSQATASGANTSSDPAAESDSDRHPGSDADSTEDPDTDSSVGPEASSGTAADDEENTDEVVDLNVCERLIACATAAVIPVTPLEALYGKDGSCWDRFASTQCWIDCAAQLETLGMSHPLLDECLQCDDDADCSVFEETPFCASSGSCCATPGGCAACGNGIVNPGEACDGDDFGDASCQTLGFRYGSLFCHPDTCRVDTSGCVGCGNGQIDSGEQCDGADLMGFDCQALGFFSGTLRCSEDCTSFDTSRCTP